MVVPDDGEGLGDGDQSLRCAGGEPAVGEVAAVDVYPVGAEPDFGGDLVAAGGTAAFA
jgi:hypothetical protein